MYGEMLLGVTVDHEMHMGRIRADAMQHAWHIADA